MATHTLDLAEFRLQFPEFANATTYPDATIQRWWDMAINYINPADSAYFSGAALGFAVSLMTAHLAKSFTLISSGVTSVLVTGSSEGSVSVSLAAPPVKTAWQWWLSTTPYGNQLRALLRVQSAGGLMAGGSLERASFRKAGGVW